MSKAYAKSGVSLENGYESVERIKKHVERTKIKGALSSIGAFGGTFDLSQYGYKEPMLVSGTDGVGTKLLVAFAMDKHETIGIDAVAMCVNDVLVQGAMPLYFLDYIAVGHNEPKQIEQIVSGVAEGCVQAECALIGGETAEMPGMYNDGHYDIAGFCVGGVDKCNFIDGSKITKGDILIGLTSSGVHSNGFSLVRQIIKEAKLDLHHKYVELQDAVLGDVILEPTKIYVKGVKQVLAEIDIHAMSHITGGGFYENVPRMLKDNQGVNIHYHAYPHLPIFDFLKEKGKLELDEMCNVFNMGIGFVMAVDPQDVDQTIALLKKANQDAYVIGDVCENVGVHMQW